MKSMRRLAFAVALILLTAGTAAARGVRIWPNQELLDKADLVVLATPTGNVDTQEHIDLPGFAGEHVVGVETRFAVAAVLKGDHALKDLVLHHYRTDDGANFPHVVNGPTFVTFTPAEGPAAFARTYLLFLLREADGRYAPVVGQTDPGLAVRAVGVDKTLMEQVADAMRKCGAIKPGMRRSDLSSDFTTEGGLSTAKHRTYVYRDCPYIKIDLDFGLSDAKQTDERPSDVIEKVSTPYLQWNIGD